jgi:hypothetical protein
VGQLPYNIQSIKRIAKKNGKGTYNSSGCYHVP